MTTAEMIKELCEQMNISVSELARRIGQTPQNFNKKLQREIVTLAERKRLQMCFLSSLSRHLFYQVGMR